MVQLLVLTAIGCALALMVFNYFNLKTLGEGTNEMADIAKIIRDGSRTFMVAEYKTIIIVVIIVAVVLSLFVEKYAGLTFVLGASMSSATCIIGMRSATYANVRTTNKARETLSIGETVKVALKGGSISGLSVQAFGLLGLLIISMITGGISLDKTGSGIIPILECNPTIMWLTT